MGVLQAQNYIVLITLEPTVHIYPTVYILVVLCLRLAPILFGQPAYQTAKVDLVV